MLRGPGRRRDQPLGVASSSRIRRLSMSRPVASTSDESPYWPPSESATLAAWPPGCIRLKLGVPRPGAGSSCAHSCCPSAAVASSPVSFWPSPWPCSPGWRSSARPSHLGTMQATGTCSGSGSMSHLSVSSATRRGQRGSAGRFWPLPPSSQGPYYCATPGSTSSLRSDVVTSGSQCLRLSAVNCLWQFSSSGSIAGSS